MGLHPQTLSFSLLHTCGFQHHHHLAQLSLSLSLSLLGTGMHCQITPDGPVGEAPSIGPLCPRLPMPLGPRNILNSHLHVLLPASVCCSQGKRWKQSRPHVLAQGRSIPRAGACQSHECSPNGGMRQERERGFCPRSVLKSSPKISCSVRMSIFSVNVR